MKTNISLRRNLLLLIGTLILFSSNTSNTNIESITKRGFESVFRTSGLSGGLGDNGLITE